MGLRYYLKGNEYYLMSVIYYLVSIEYYPMEIEDYLLIRLQKLEYKSYFFWGISI